MSSPTHNTKTLNPLARFKRITIKIGSALLVNDLTGTLKQSWLESLCADIFALRQNGFELLVVSSGAIALGRGILGLRSGALALEQSQAAASVGQIALGQAWASALQAHDLAAGQILITPNITEERRYFLNARTSINTLLELGAVPVINENDSVATAEIRYGDNDRLSARVAAMVEADALVILSDVDGLYDAPPDQAAKGTSPARHVPRVEKITPQILAMAGTTSNNNARGGMVTKLAAAQTATKSGTAMLIAKGTKLHPLAGLMKGGRHTLFVPDPATRAARKRWILGALQVAGTVTIDPGAAEALKKGKSLLPVGVRHVSGDFSRGDPISIVGPDATELARGLAGLGSNEATKAMGKKGPEISKMFGPGHRTELVHADNLVLVYSEK
ncbi:MAG: glutamate 5-kinase [Alphaproteobacteria bacterium]|nr:glutamate 5-kinase [Alphaproteobacteria bacterium]